jgi:hypothetical protein
MSTQIKVGPRVIGTVRHEEDGTWTYEGPCVQALRDLNKPLIEGCATKDAAVRALRLCYTEYALHSADVPADLGWYNVPGIHNKEFLMRPPLAKDSVIYGQRKVK